MGVEWVFGGGGGGGLSGWMASGWVYSGCSGGLVRSTALWEDWLPSMFADVLL